MITSVVPKLPFIDKEATLNFYANQLDFELISDYGDYLILTMGAVELHFFAYPSLQPSKSDFMIYLRVDKDIEALYASYKNMQPPFNDLRDLKHQPWRQKEFSLIDPNGTLLTFGESF